MSGPSAQERAHARGDVLAGRYRLERIVGEGGMAVVWAATHALTRKRVALKLLRAAKSASPAMRRRMLREARATCAVKHPNVLEIHDILELDDGASALVMDLLEGESLGGKLRRVKRLSIEEASALVLPVVSAVGTARASGIVHRDLKPDNIFLARGSGEKPDVKVLDFGIAKLTAAEGDAAATAGLTATGSVLGTPHYMAPEQIFGERDVDHGVDIWALGVILFECLSGTRPAHGENVGQLVKAITTTDAPPLANAPSDVTELVARMLTRERAKRPADLREVAEVLGRYTAVKVPPFGPPAIEPDRDDAPSLPPDPARALSTRTSSLAVHPPTELDGTLEANVRGRTRPPLSRPRRWIAGVSVAAVVALSALLVVVVRRARVEAPPSAPTAMNVTAQVPAPEPVVAPEVNAGDGGAMAREIADAGSELRVPKGRERRAEPAKSGGAKREAVVGGATSATSAPSATAVPSREPPRTRDGVIESAPF